MRIIDEIKSPVNGKIKVASFLGQKSVWVGGFQQSGPLIAKLWEKFLERVALSECKDVLILGLGCGSALKSVLHRFPDCHVTGVEIDREMIRIGKKYFALGGYHNLKIVCDDAAKFCQTTRKKYDLILVDMYRGNLPEKRKINFSKLLKPQGKGIINVLSGLENKPLYLG